MTEGELARILEKYSYGYCIWLTLALHDKYGWDIYAQIEIIKEQRKSHNYISHSYVVMPNGYEVDIYGPQEKVDRFTNKIVKLTRKQFVKLINESSPNSDVEFEYQRAKEEVDNVISILLEPMF